MPQTPLYSISTRPLMVEPLTRRRSPFGIELFTGEVQNRKG